MTPRNPRLAVALFLGFALGCSAGNRDRGESCNDSDACAVGLTCLDGACRSPCNVGTDCPEGTGCAAGLCMPLAAGVCGQAADCRTPPDACRTTLGARCLQGRCEYNRATTLNCREECTTAANCDEAGSCQDPASARCVDTGCVYDPLPNGTACTGTTGVCYNGTCVNCLENADCDPRNFGYDLCRTGTCTNRVCTFTEIAGPGTVCRGATRECDVAEECQAGACPADDVQSAGTVCNPNPGPGEDNGRCDGGTPDCRRLAVMPFVSRYFLEEASTGADRVDFFDHLPLMASGSTGISRVQTSTGAGVAWASEASSYVYCASLGTADFSQTQMLLTFEAVITASNANMTDSTIMFMGPASAGGQAKLGVKRVTTDPAGQVTFTGTFGDSTAVYTWVATIGPRTVVHLVFDGYQAATNNVMRLFIDGVEAARQSAGQVPSSLPLVDTDIFCIGNDMVAGSGAFAGSLWYVGAYDEDMTETEIMDAAIRLSISDE